MSKPELPILNEDIASQSRYRFNFRWAFAHLGYDLDQLEKDPGVWLSPFLMINTPIPLVETLHLDWLIDSIAANSTLSQHPLGRITLSSDIVKIRMVEPNRELNFLTKYWFHVESSKTISQDVREELIELPLTIVRRIPYLVTPIVPLNKAG